MCNEAEPWEKQFLLDEAQYFADAFWDILEQISEKVGIDLDDYSHFMERLDELIQRSEESPKAFVVESPQAAPKKRGDESPEPAQMGLF